MPLAADHHLGGGAVVAEKEDQRVVKGLHRLELGDDPTDLTIHHLHHGRVDRHLRGLKLPLIGRECLPRHRPIDLSRPQLFQGVWEGVGRTHMPLDRGRLGGHDAEFLQPRPSHPPDIVPAGPVAVAILRDHLRRRLEWKVRCRECDVVEKGGCCMIAGMLGEAGDRVVADRRRGVKTVRGRRGRHALRAGGVEVVALARGGDLERPVKPLPPWVAVEVPLARVVRPIAGGLEQGREEPGPGWPRGVHAPLRARQRVPTDRLRVVARQQRPAGRPAAGGVGGLRVPQASRREPIEMRCVDLAALTAEIRKAEVVGQDHHHVGCRIRCGGCQCCHGDEDCTGRHLKASHPHALPPAAAVRRGFHYRHPTASRSRQ